MPITATSSPLSTQRLSELSKQGNAADFAAELKKVGPAVMSEALDTFYKLDRERPDADQSLNHIRDLKNSVQDYMQRNFDDAKKNQTEAFSRASQIQAGTDPTIKTTPAGVTPIKNEYPKFSSNYGQSKIESGTRVITSETVAAKPADYVPLKGLAKFLSDLGTVQGTYTAAVMLPGPASASMLSVLNAQKESYSSDSSSSAHFSSQSSSSGAAASLLALGAGGFRSTSSANGSSQSDSHSQFEKLTADREIVPILTELRDRLERPSVRPASSGTFQGTVHGYETMDVKVKKLFRAETTESKNITYYNQGQFDHTLAQFESQPEHAELPLNSTDLH